MHRLHVTYPVHRLHVTYPSAFSRVSCWLWSPFLASREYLNVCRRTPEIEQASACCCGLRGLQHLPSQPQGGKMGTRTHAGGHGQHIACPGCPEALGAGAGESLGLQRISLT